jgi:hypothetical protein
VPKTPEIILSKSTAFGWRSAFSAAIMPVLTSRALAPGVSKTPEIILSKPTAFGWRSPSSAAIKPLLTLWALAPEVPKTPEIIFSKSAFAFRKANENCLHRTSMRHKRLHNRGRAALQRRVTRTQIIGALAPVHFCEHTMNSRLWKKIHHSRTKPVIAGDTTYGVSLLTGTISGSNFAIP